MQIEQCCKRMTVAVFLYIIITCFILYLLVVSAFVVIGFYWSVGVYMTEDPEYDGGSTVVEYLVTMNGDMSGTRDVYRGHDTQCTVAGLLPGRLYTFQVKANNKAGVCPLSFCSFHCFLVLLCSHS